jgi:hypothetical protein
VLRSTRRGVVSSALGTLAMDALLYGRYRRGDGTAAFRSWESSEGLVSWDHAPAPALVAKRALEGALGREIPAPYARPLNNITHWGFGLAAGAAYGLLAGLWHTPKAWFGIPFGAAVWSGGYVVLPQLGVYRPIAEYDVRTLEKDLGAHLVFGTVTAGAYSLLAHRRE